MFGPNSMETFADIYLDYPESAAYGGAIPQGAAGAGPISKDIARQPDRNNRQSTSYEQTLGDIRRLRSTRLEQPLGNTMKRARSSRIIDGPGGISAQSGASDAPENGNTNRQNMQIVHDRDPETDSQLMFGSNQMAL